MPRFEILYHATCELGCSSAEDAAALIHAQMTESGGDQVRVHQLAVWREDGDAGASPLDAAARAHLEVFFREVQRCAQEAEERFRGDVEAILLAQSPRNAADAGADNATTGDERERSCTK